MTDDANFLGLLFFLIGVFCMVVGVAIGIWLDDAAKPDPHKNRDNWGM